MIKKIIGGVAALAIIGGFSFQEISHLIQDSRQTILEKSENLPQSLSALADQATKSITETGTVSDLENSTRSDNSLNKNASQEKKMRLEIPAFLTDRPEEVVWHTGYTVSYNRKTKLPNWVAWQLDKERTYGKVSRSDNFEPDPDIKKGHTAEDSDYRRSGYSRGHMCPAADNKFSEKAMEESFYFSNICPQLQSLNGGDWKELEDKCRSWARKYGNIYIACGPIITSSSPKTIGANKVVVPDAFYKVIMMQKSDNEAQAIGYIFKHKKQNRPLSDYAVTVDEVEEVTGIDFFSKMPDHLEKRMEEKYDLSYWK